MEKDSKKRLEQEGIEYRKNEIKNLYNDTTNTYSGENENALSHDDEDHPHGKGTGVEMGYAIRDLNAPKTQMSYKNLDTSKGGGSYDIYGAKGVKGAFQGDAGRNALLKMNIYSKDNAYGKDSVTVDASIKGQYFN